MTNRCFICDDLTLYITNRGVTVCFFVIAENSLHFKNKMIFIEIDQTFFFHFSEFDG